MINASVKRVIAPACAVLAAGLLSASVGVQAGAPAGPPPAPLPAAEAALFDPTGVWESVITQDWYVRMVTPIKGEYSNIPLNPNGRRIADQWDWRQPVPDVELCKPYGAPAVMRLPGKIRISWQDKNTLKLETEAGTQTRLIHFAGRAPAVAPVQPDLQGTSIGQWRFQAQRRGFGGAPARRPGEGGVLQVTTTNLAPGWLRRNGVPYSTSTRLTEYYNVIETPAAGPWLTLTTVVEDPEYLRAPYVSSAQFRRAPANSTWNPEPCQVIPPFLDTPPPGAVGGGGGG